MIIKSFVRKLINMSRWLNVHILYLNFQPLRKILLKNEICYNIQPEKLYNLQKIDLSMTVCFLFIARKIFNKNFCTIYKNISRAQICSCFHILSLYHTLFPIWRMNKIHKNVQCEMLYDLYTITYFNCIPIACEKSKSRREHLDNSHCFPYETYFNFLTSDMK